MVKKLKEREIIRKEFLNAFTDTYVEEVGEWEPIYRTGATSHTFFPPTHKATHYLVIHKIIVANPTGAPQTVTFSHNEPTPSPFLTIRIPANSTPDPFELNVGLMLGLSATTTAADVAITILYHLRPFSPVVSD